MAGSKRDIIIESIAVGLVWGFLSIVAKILLGMISSLILFSVIGCFVACWFYARRIKETPNPNEL